MRSIPVLTVGLVLAVTALAIPPAAHADGIYYTEAFGGTKVDDQLADRIQSGFRIRLAVGWRAKRFALEGFVAPILSDTQHPEGDHYSSGGLLTYGLDLKYIKPVASHVELYLRGSVSRGILEGEDYAGRGLGVGAGLQLKGKVPALGLLFWPLFFVPKMPGPKITGALFVDNGFEFYRLHRGGALDGSPSIDARLSHFTIGFGLGSDF